MNTSHSKRYNHLNLSERIVIQFLYENNHSIRKIARCLGRSPSTISRELRPNFYHENGKKIYSANKAQIWYKLE